MRQFRRLQLSVIIGLLLTLWPLNGQAQAETISWDITGGFDGSFKAGAWFPLSIAIANSGPEISGTLDVRFRGGNASTYSQTIELPHNSNKRLVVPVLGEINQDGGVQADVSLRSGTTLIRSERINLNALAVMRLVVGVLSDESNILPELTNLRPDIDNGFGTTLLRLSGATLPDRGELLQTFDVIFVHAIDPGLWTAAQHSALQHWVNTGGQLVVGGDVRVMRGLSDLMPALAQETAVSTSIRALEQSGWRARPNGPEQIPLIPLEPKPGAEVALQADAARPLLVRRWYGLGSVTVAAFGLEALRDAGDPASFWSRVLHLDTQQASTTIQLRDQGFFTLQQALQLPALRLPSILGFLGFLLLYIVTVGPLNYLLLRRIDRREWAYLTVPLLVVLFSVGAYAWGTAGRGRSIVLSELSIVRVHHDGAQGQASTFLALFSPSRHAYDIRLAPDALVADLQPPWNRQGRAPDVLYAEDTTRVPELLIDVGAARALSVERPVPAPVLEVTSNGDQTALTLRNESSQTFDELMVTRGDGRAQLVEGLAPGEERTIQLVLDRFVNDGFNPSSSPVFDRHAVLNQLGSAIVPGLGMGEPDFVEALPPGLEGDRALPPPPAAAPSSPDAPTGSPVAMLQPDPTGQLFILGWQSEPLTTVTIDGESTTGTGETLFIWPVRKES